MAYPLLYGATASLLHKLEATDTEDLLPHEYRKILEQWREALTFLPFIETDGDLNSISEFVYGLHDISEDACFGDWKNLEKKFTKFLDGWHPKKIRESEKSLPSLLRKNLADKFTKFVHGLHPQKNRESEKSLLSSSLRYAPSSDESPDVKLKLDGLPPHLIPCLAYCALYPEGSIFVRETLVNHWMAHGFLGVTGEYADYSSHDEDANFLDYLNPRKILRRITKRQMQRGSSSGGLVLKDKGKRMQRHSSSGGLDLEDEGNKYFDELLHSWGVFVEPTFVFGGHQRGDPIYSCKLDALVHQAARRMASNEVVILPDAIHGSVAAAPAATAWHIASHKESSSTPSQHQWHPHTYMCFTPQISHQVGLQRLRVLDMAGTQFKELPTTDSSQLLRYLGLSRNTLLESLDLSRFPNLQTAAFDRCLHLKTLSSTIKIWKLRHLYYTSNASSLNIYVRNLRILQVSHCPLLTSLSFYPDNLKRLLIFDCPRLTSLDEVEDFLQKAEELIFHNCARLDLNSGKCIDDFDRLRYMEIIGLPKLTRLPEGLRSARYINYLMIADCISLRSMDDILNHLWSLEKLRIYSCRNLSIAPSVFQYLTVLKSLDIRECPKITATWTSDAAATDVAPFVSHIPDPFIDGQRLSFDQKAVGDQKLISSAQPGSNLPVGFPFFVLSSESFGTTKSSEGPYHCYPFLRLFHSDEFEFERDKLSQLLLRPRPFCKCKFDCLLDKGFIIESRTDNLTGKSKYKINVKKVFTPSDMSENFAVIDDENVDISKATHVSVVKKNIDPIKLFNKLEGMTGLKTFLLIRHYGSSLNQIPSTFFKIHKDMEALDLSGSHISELPSSVGEMKLLRFLDLSYTLIQRIPESIHHLGKLQTLKLKECKHLHSLPNGIKQFTNLRHLDFDVLGQLTCMPKEMGALTDLRNLSAFIVSKEDGCTLRELKDLNYLAGSFCISGLEYATGADAREAEMVSKRCLSQLHLKWDESYHYPDTKEAMNILSGLQPSFNTEELQISYYPYHQFPLWIQDKQFDILVRLEFLGCKNNEFGLLGRLPCLKYLNITDLNKVKCIDLGHEDGLRFPKLETLIIDGMDELKSFNNARDGDFPWLSELSLKYCPNLTQLDFLPFLSSLTSLEISHCESLESLESLPSDPLPKDRIPLETLIIYQCSSSLEKACSKGGIYWDKIKHVPHIWIDMKGIGREDTDSDKDSNYSDEDSNRNDDNLIKNSDKDSNYSDEDSNRNDDTLIKKSGGMSHPINKKNIMRSEDGRANVS